MSTNTEITLHEITEHLFAEREVQACPATVWYFFTKRGLTHKKGSGTRPSRSVRTSRPGARTGSAVRSTSIRNG